MNLAIFYPPESICSAIAKIWLITDADAKEPKKLLLDHTFHIIISADVPGYSCVSAPVTSMRYPGACELLLSPEADKVYIGISFFPWHKGIHEVCKQLGNLLNFLPDNVSEILDPPRFQSIAERMYKTWESTPVDNISKELIESLVGNPDAALETVYNKFPICSRRIEQVLRSSSGTSARFLKKKLRLLQALKLMRQKPTLSLTEIAHQSGYYDQAHFTRVFREFTEQSPRTFLREQERVCWDLIQETVAI